MVGIVSGIMEKEYIIDLNNCDQEEIDNIFNLTKPDIAFHFAAQTIVSSYKDH